MADDLASIGVSIETAQAEANLRSLESMAKRAGISVDEMANRVAAAKDKFGGTSAAVSKFEGETKKATGATVQIAKDAERAASQIQQIDTVTRQASGGIGVMGGAFRSIVTLLAGGALLAGIDAAITKISALGDLMQDTRLSADFLQGFRIGAAQAGVSQEELNSSLKAFTDVSKKARSEAIQFYGFLDKALPGAAAQFQALAGKDDGQSKRLELLQKALAGAKDETTQFQLAQAALGSQSERTIDLFSKGGKAFEDYIETARRFGILVDGDLRQKADDARKTLDTLAVIVSDKLRVAIVALIPDLVRLLPVLEKIGATIVDVLANSLSPENRPDQTLTRELTDTTDRLKDLVKERDTIAASSKDFSFGKFFGGDGGLADAEAVVKKYEAYAKRLNGILTDRNMAGLRPDAVPKPNAGQGYGGQKPIEDVTAAFEKQIAAINKRSAALEADFVTVGRSVGEQTKLRVAFQLQEFLTEKGITDFTKYADAIEKAGERAGNAAQKLAEARLNSDIKFDADTSFLSDSEKQIASILRQTKGDDWQNFMKGPQADAIRFNNSLKNINDTIRDAAQSFTKDFVSGLVAGKSAMSALGNAATNLSAKLTDKAITSLFSGDLLSAGIQGVGALVTGLFGASQKRREEEEKTAKEIADRMSNYATRATQAGIDTSTRLGELQSQELKFQQERQAEAVSGNQAIASLLQAQNAERLAVQKSWDQKDLDALNAANAANAEAEKAAQEASLQRMQTYQDRLFATTIDTNTLGGALAAYERQAEKDRLEEVQSGGQQLALLTATQEAEKLQIFRKFNDDAVKAAQDAADAQRKAMASVQQYIDQVGKQIRDYLNGLKTGSSSTLNPQERLNAAQAQFNQQFALAQAGDRTALGSITTYSQTLLDAAKSFFASSSGYTSIFNDVTAKLQTIPDNLTVSQVVSADSIIAAIQDAKAATVSTINSQTASTLQAAYGTTGAVNNATTAVNTTGASNDNLTAAQSALIASQNALAAQQVTYLQSQQTLLGAIRDLTGASRDQIALLKDQLTNNSISTSFTAIQGASDSPTLQTTTNNNLLTALNKIVLNTYATALNTYAMVQINSSAKTLPHGVGTLATGGWITGGTPNMDSVLLADRSTLGMPDEFVINKAVAQANKSWLPAFNATGRLPAMPVMPRGNDNSRPVGNDGQNFNALGSLLVKAMATISSTEMQSSREDIAALRSDVQRLARAIEGNRPQPGKGRTAVTSKGEAA